MHAVEEDQHVRMHCTIDPAGGAPRTTRGRAHTLHIWYAHMTFRRGKEHTLGTGFCAKKAPRPPSTSKLRSISPAGIMLCDWACQDYRMCVIQSTLTGLGVRGGATKHRGLFSRRISCAHVLCLAPPTCWYLSTTWDGPDDHARAGITRLAITCIMGCGKSGGFFHAEPGLGSPCCHRKLCAATCSGQDRALAFAVPAAPSPRGKARG